jgi:hypothetical protein
MTLLGGGQSAPFATGAEPFWWRSESVARLAALSSRRAKCDAAKGEVGMARSANVQGAKLH